LPRTADVNQRTVAPCARIWSARSAASRAASSTRRRAASIAGITAATSDPRNRLRRVHPFVAAGRVADETRSCGYLPGRVPSRRSVSITGRPIPVRSRVSAASVVSPGGCQVRPSATLRAVRHPGLGGIRSQTGCRRRAAKRWPASLPGRCRLVHPARGRSARGGTRLAALGVTRLRRPTRLRRHPRRRGGQAR